VSIANISFVLAARRMGCRDFKAGPYLLHLEVTALLVHREGLLRVGVER
jgi:hypothetical protein